MSDLVEGLQKRASLDDETVQNIRVFEAYSSKFYKELGDTYSVAGITDFVTLYAEPLPEDERNMEEDDFKINAFNFDREPNKPHGIPFKFVVKPVCIPANPLHYSDNSRIKSVLMFYRVRCLQLRKTGSRREWEFGESNSRKSSLPLYPVRHTQIQHILKTVSSFLHSQQ